MPSTRIFRLRSSNNDILSCPRRWNIVKYARTHRFLGIIIDRGLSWSSHCVYLKKRASTAYVLKLMRAESRGSSIRSMLQLYRTLFLGLRHHTLVIGKLARTGTEHLPMSARCSSIYATIVLATKHPLTMYTTVHCLRAHIRHISRIPDHHLALLPSESPRATFLTWSAITTMIFLQ